MVILMGVGKKIAGLLIFTLFFSLMSLKISGDKEGPYFTGKSEKPPFLSADSVWVDSVFNTLTPDERISQLLMYPAYSNKDSKHEEYIKSLIRDHKIGGLIFMQGGPYRQVKLVNEYQNISKVPLLISMDAEWSLSMRLDSTVMYPRQMMLGAIQDNKLIYEMGAEFARQLKRVGVHISFAPAVDVNNNSLNPVINYRSFGEDRLNVAVKAYNYMKGLQDNGVLASAKHFPGHGDTDVDSHHSLPEIKHNYDRLDSVELFPFKYLIKRGIGSVMVSHLFVPAIDSSEGIPATLSQKAITDLLKNELEFEGLVITDAMNMGGITKYFKPGEADVKALLAGNDIILFPNDVKLVISEIKKAIDQGLITQDEIDKRCKKVLKIKYWAGLDNFQPISQDNLYSDLNNTEAELIQQKLIENALTLTSNKNSVIPLNNLDTLKIATISFGNNNLSNFQNRINYYAQTDNFIYNSSVNMYGRKGLLDKLKNYDIVIASIHNTNRTASRKYGIADNTISFIDELALQTKVILDIFANPYSLGFFKNSDNFEASIVSYNDWDITQDLSAQLIFGGIPALGRLPVSSSQDFPVGTGYDTEKVRLKYSKIPEDAGVDSKLLYKVDSVVNSGLFAGAYPGAQIVAARNGVVFYQKSFGNHTDINSKKVQDLDIYDLASVTKVIGTNLALMKLYDEEQYDIDDKLSIHLKALAGTNKTNIKIRDVLTHRAGLKSWIPFYAETIKPQRRNDIYKPQYSDNYSVQVADKMFMDKYYIDTIYDIIYKSDMNKYGRYVYSDLGFYLMQLFIEQNTNENLENYLEENFYLPLGAWSTTYLPLYKFDKNDVVPTELDTLFRKQLLHGYVHDQGAAMLGGISGHAGLFSNANDIAKILQMLLNKGSYGGKKYLRGETIELFTKYQFAPEENRRGLCWDKKHPTNCATVGIGSESSSELAYGHSGYTGTMVWSDPEFDFLYVFNSNRVYPIAENPKILKMNIRTDIEEIFYQAFKSFDLEQKSIKK